MALVDLCCIKHRSDPNLDFLRWNQVSSLLTSFRDATIALQNAVVATESLRLGTLYIGGVLAQGAAGFIGTPPHTVPAGLVLLRHSDERPEHCPRLPMHTGIHRSAHRRPSDEAIRPRYR